MKSLIVGNIVWVLGMAGVCCRSYLFDCWEIAVRISTKLATQTPQGPWGNFPHTFPETP
jgi:hypothetical protein